MPITLPHLVTVEEFAWGITLVAFTMAVHGIGVVVTLNIGSRLHRGFSGWFGRLWRLSRLITATWMLVVVHLFEVTFIWGAFFWWQDAFTSTRDAVYYALMQYTTVGSALALPDRMRVLGGMVSMAGLLTFAWSTSVLLVLAQDFQKEYLEDGPRRGPGDGRRGPRGS
jgi:hypothetical protein